jgi:hypothetical protein
MAYLLNVLSIWKDFLDLAETKLIGFIQVASLELIVRQYMVVGCQVGGSGWKEQREG